MILKSIKPQIIFQTILNHPCLKLILVLSFETVRHVESECHAWFEANMKQEEHTVTTIFDQIASSERYLIDGSWTHDVFFSGYGWTWKTSGGTTQLLGGRNQRRRISPLHSELDALLLAMECMLQLSTCQAFGTNCKDLISIIQDPGA